LFSEFVDLIAHLVDLALEDALVGEQLGIVRLQLDVLVQHIGILPGQEVDGLLELGECSHLAFLPGEQPGHDRPDEASGERPHEQVDQYLCGVRFHSIS